MNLATKYVVIGLLIVILGAVTYLVTSTPRIGYVQSQDLIYGFEGTKNVQADLDKMKKQWQDNLDTLNFDFQKALSRLEADIPSLSEEQQFQRKQALMSQQENSLRYAQSVEEKVVQEEAQLMEGVLNQVNSLAIQYAEEEGYDIILGTTNAGSIIHGDEALNVTAELLEYMNSKYYNENN